MVRGQSRELILEAGKDLIYRQGYYATGVAQITEKAGVPKGSFFNYFKTKEDFVIEALELYTQNMIAYLNSTLLDAGAPYMKNLRKMYKGWSSKLFLEYEGKGCMAANLAQELAINSPKVREALEYSFERLEAPFTECLKRAQKNQELDSDQDIEALSSAIYNGWQGAQLRAKAIGNNAPLEQFRTKTFEKLVA